MKYDKEYFIEEKKNRELIPIDIDLVREMRFQGRNAEANELIRIHQETLKKSWKETRRQMHNITAKIERFNEIKRGFNSRKFRYYLYKLFEFGKKYRMIKVKGWEKWISTKEKNEQPKKYNNWS